MTGARDHGGLDEAMARYGGRREDWVDLSTGLNPVPYPVPPLDPQAWSALPARAAQEALTDAARDFWGVPDDAAILAAPGVASLIAHLPALVPPGRVHIPATIRTRHAAAFAAHGWTEGEDSPDARVLAHPDNPTGGWSSSDDLGAPFTVIDESYADVSPYQSLVSYADREGTLILKSFGRFWGLAGLRLGFAIGPQDLIDRLSALLGPFAVSGPALEIGTRALLDRDWAAEARTRLNEDAAHLDALMVRAGAGVVGGTSLFRLYRVDDAAAWQDRLAQARVWSRIYPDRPSWLRLGLPAPEHWAHVEQAI
ncbi:MAG: aminotransferase class I/II-fold pyridoxal phosphate-dependent enzyme [Roseovarius sp.]